MIGYIQKYKNIHSVGMLSECCMLFIFLIDLFSILLHYFIFLSIPITNAVRHDWQRRTRLLIYYICDQVCLVTAMREHTQGFIVPRWYYLVTV